MPIILILFVIKLDKLITLMTCLEVQRGRRVEGSRREGSNRQGSRREGNGSPPPCLDILKISKEK